MKIHRTASLTEVSSLQTAALRDHFLLNDCFQEGEIRFFYTDLDRAVVGGICPRDQPLEINAAKALRAAFFFERREAGVLNIGPIAATAEVDGQTHTLEPCECLYIGRGSQKVQFTSSDPGTAASLYFVSFPAHKEYPTGKATLSDANEVKLGSAETANERTIYQFIHEDGLSSCQLVMGFTRIGKGSVWNTMPPHTHERRCELYLYFNLLGDDVVFHFMGEPSSTRHLVVRNREIVLSPPWSIHAGCGTGGYDFVWAMGGENQRFDDMDPAELASLR
jgi:4-deoxy-L-threo-5-hexosulose-uronate ketol-isomerase